MKASIRKMGNSQGIIIPKSLINQLNFKVSVEMTVVDGTIVLSKPTPKVRDGWDDAAKQLAASGDDDLVWPDFDNQADEEWVW